MSNVSVTQSSNGDLIVTLAESGAAMAFPPFSGPWIAMSVAQGVLSGLGAKVFEDVTGGAKPTLQQIMEALLPKIRYIIKQAIQDEALRSLSASRNSLASLYRMYINNQDVELLDDLLVKADEVTSQAASLGLPATDIFANAGSLELTIIQERARVSGSEGERRNVSARAKELIIIGKEYRPNLLKANAGRFGALWQHPGDNWFYHYFLQHDEDDGADEKRFPTWRIEDAQPQYDAHINSEFLRLEKKHLFGLYGTMERWRQLVPSA